MKPDAVCIVIGKDDGTYLMIQRAAGIPFSGYWTPVTGSVENGETCEDAVIREVYEEVRLVVRPQNKVWECLTENEKYTLHWWTATLISGDVTPEPAEVADYCWINPGSVRTLKTFNADITFFEDILPAVNGINRE